MEGNIIKSFLVGLGFGVDDGDLAKFNKAIASASLKVAALYTAVKVSAAGIFLGISKISEGFEQLGYEYRIIAPMINKTLILRQALLSAYKAANINIVKAVQQSVLFNLSLTKTKFALEAVYKSVGLKFLPMLTRQMDVFRKQIYNNMPKIQAALEKFVNFVFKAFEATTILGGRLWSILQRVYDFFKKLDQATDGWSTIILGVIAAWKLLNLSFLATPLGLLITGLTTLLALWDDFKTFKEGGQALINWGSDTTKVMVGVAAAIAAVAAAIGTVILAMKAYAVLSAAIAVINLPFIALVATITALIGLLTVLIFKWSSVKKVAGDFFSGIGSKILDFASGTPNIGSNVSPQNNPTAAPLANPVGANNVQNNSTRQSVSQETNIIVQGSADANATGKAISGEQSKVNFDMARNMRGAVR